MRYENSRLMVIKCMQWIIKHTRYLRYLSKIDSVPPGSMLTSSIAQSTTSRGESGFAVLPVSRKFSDFKQIWQKNKLIFACYLSHNWVQGVSFWAFCDWNWNASNNLGIYVMRFDFSVWKRCFASNLMKTLDFHIKTQKSIQFLETEIAWNVSWRVVVYH